MAGHSKWANIKHKKGAADAKRGKIFTKLIKEITVAARLGGGGLDGNARLRLAVDKARAQSVPKDTIERAIKKGTGELDGVVIEEVSYEGYGPGGVALLVDGATDNKTRTVAEIRMIFSKNGGNMGESGSVGWMFEKKGVLRVNAADVKEDELFETALDAGADDLKSEDDTLVILTNFEDFQKVQDKLFAKKVPIREAGVEMLPKNTVAVDNEEQARKLFALIETLEDNDDVQHVWANFDVDETVMEKLGG
jgi:YebC/PmpR family DNA-binding regulatory protein